MMDPRLTSVQLNLTEVGATAAAAIADVAAPLTSAGWTPRLALSPATVPRSTLVLASGVHNEHAGLGVRTTDLGTAWRGDMTTTSKCGARRNDQNLWMSLGVGA
ncbi:hypothetical protein MHPYR_510001 [uncultured Mycobacterium sp.]|uniref:Uncharacterized protein n=1 Tax=uncultured Mycobacterium sp. TaxID=171292 RepID=A0A1Y5PHA3_9MYCO|nr:hypothetical protein MHPYR_510001 [uncultured Mycobacterium sp.]